MKHKSVRTIGIMSHLIGHIKGRFPGVEAGFSFCRNAGGVCVRFDIPDELEQEVTTAIQQNGYEVFDFHLHRVKTDKELVLETMPEGLKEALKAFEPHFERAWEILRSCDRLYHPLSQRELQVSVWFAGYFYDRRHLSETELVELLTAQHQFEDIQTQYPELKKCDIKNYDQPFLIEYDAPK